MQIVQLVSTIVYIKLYALFIFTMSKVLKWPSHLSEFSFPAPADGRVDSSYCEGSTIEFCCSTKRFNALLCFVLYTVPECVDVCVREREQWISTVCALYTGLRRKRGSFVG